MTKRGDKIRAGRLLTDFLMQIAQEKVAVEGEGPGDILKITKAEALARQVWDRALGRYEEIDLATGKIVKPFPDKAMIELIWTRMEGKAGTAEDVEKNNESIPDKISRKSRDRLNKL